MTVEIHGFVKTLEHAGSGVDVTIQCEASRMAHPMLWKFHASHAETEAYRIGTYVVIQVRPLPATQGQKHD